MSLVHPSCSQRIQLYDDDDINDIEGDDDDGDDSDNNGLCDVMDVFTLVVADVPEFYSILFLGHKPTTYVAVLLLIARSLASGLLYP